MPVSALHDFIERYMHKILSLELELREYGRTGVLSYKNYDERVNRLSKLKQKLQKLQNFCLHSENDPEQEFEKRAMPVFEACSPDELRVCEHFLTSHERFYYRQLKKIKKSSDMDIRPSVW